MRNENKQRGLKMSVANELMKAMEQNISNGQVYENFRNEVKASLGAWGGVTEKWVDIVMKSIMHSDRPIYDELNIGLMKELLADHDGIQYAVADTIAMIPKD